MNRISLKGKIAILVGILAATILAVAIVGGRQLARTNAEIQNLVNVTNRAMDTASQLRIALLGAIRAEKNAVLSPDDLRTAQFAQEAEAGIADIEKLLPQLHDLVAETSDAAERQQLDEFERALQAFNANQKTVLQLALLNTNARGAELIVGDTRDRFDAIDKLLAAVQARLSKQLTGDQEGTDVDKLRRIHEIDALLDTALQQSYRIVNLLFLHMSATDDAEMNQLDMQLTDATSSLEKSLQEAKPMVDEVDRVEITQAMVESQSLLKVVSRIQKLSHTNSNLKSSQLSLTSTVELGNQADSALQRLQLLFAAQAEAGRHAVQTSYLRSLAIIGGAALVGIVAGLLLARKIALSITVPVSQGVEIAHALAQGDLTRRLRLTQNDEIGLLTRAIDQAADNFAAIISEVHGVSEQIGASSAELGSVSHQLLSQSEEMSTQAGFVAGSTEQMTANINTMAAAAEQMSMNVASISSASEEISVNVGSISTAAEQTSTNVGSVVDAIQETTQSFKAVANDACAGAQISAKAAELAAAATQTMNTLDRSAGEISKVTEMIKLIAMQTNLLALNATIEATSAGEAGKGFAVVANEIKQLANQSGKAAEDIARMIEGIQNNTRCAVSVIDEVAETISAINTASDRIFKAVDTQTQTATASADKLNAAGSGVEHIARSITEVAKGTNDMSRNASEAAKAATDVSHNASQAAQAIREVSSNIHGVSASTQQNTASAQQVNLAAAQLQKIAGNLEQIVRRFRLNKGHQD